MLSTRMPRRSRFNITENWAHPTSAFINYDLMMMDEEMRFTVTSLRRVS